MDEELLAVEATCKSGNEYFHAGGVPVGQTLGDEVEGVREVVGDCISSFGPAPSSNGVLRASEPQAPNG